MPQPSDPLQLKRQLASLPHQPGVYVFRDAGGHVLYVGKAKDLARRVASYFTRPRALSPAKQLMVGRIASVEPVLVATEQEALLLEAALVHRKQPPFNIELRDDKRFVYVVLTYDPPQVRATRFPVRRPGTRDRTFGPYASAEAVYQTLRALKSALVGARYLPNLFVTPRRGQLLPQGDRGIEEAPPAFAPADQRQAEAAVGEVERFLRGRTATVRRQLWRQLEAAAKARRYEHAALLRDQLRAIDQILERQEAVAPTTASWDVVSLFREGSRSAVNVFKVRGGKLVDQLATSLSHSATATEAQILAGFLVQYYGATDDRPDLLLASLSVDVAALSRGAEAPLPPVTVPQRGRGRLLLSKGTVNAEHHLRTAALRHEPTWDGSAAVRQLALALGLEEKLARIELIDVSHLSGREAVASLVVATDGAPDSSHYRRFRLRVAPGGDDYASIREVVSRRARHRDWPSPDLLAIDGGPGQLSAARQALAGTPLASVPTVALAKREELLFTDPRGAPLRLPRRSAALRLVQRLRDEAHRFAITYHRTVRSRAVPRRPRAH